MWKINYMPLILLQIYSCNNSFTRHHNVKPVLIDPAFLHTHVMDAP